MIKLEREGRACTNVEEVIQLAEEKGLTDKEIADIADCSVVAVRRWRDVGRGSYDHVHKVLAYLSGEDVILPRGKNLQEASIEDLAHRAAMLGFETNFRYVGKQRFSFDIENCENKNRGYAKFRFQGKEFGQGRLVLSVIKYLVNNKGFDFAQLEEAFPPNIQGSLGVISRIEDVKDTRRYFMKSDEIIILPDGDEIAVCREWGTGINPNTPRFIEAALRLGCEIDQITQ